MKASEKFKSAIEQYLQETALTDTALALHLAKASKNIESCMHYIFGEVKKTGLCAFDNQEIFDMAVQYYSDDAIGVPAELQCRVVVNQPAKADLFTPSPLDTPLTAKPAVLKPAKPLPTTLTLFDL